jgi:protein-tyrosine sulfotransferase
MFAAAHQLSLRMAWLDDFRSLLGFIRLEQARRFGLRALGLPGARADDFVVALPRDAAERLRAIADAVRGARPIPAIFVHGVLPRSGTNFLADALALHPHVYPNPGRLWEFPLLYVAPGAKALRQEFLSMFKRSEDVVGPYDLLAYLASGWLLALQQEAAERRILLKSPHVQNITLAPHVFPHDVQILCLRDGRDVVHSSLATFPRWRPRGKGLHELAREWRYATEAVLTFEPGGANAYQGAKVVRFEALVEDPQTVMHGILTHAGLDPDLYDFQALRRLPVRGSSALAMRPGEERWMQRDKPEDFRPIGRWQGVWTDRQKRQFKAIAGATLIEAGYASDPGW